MLTRTCSTCGRKNTTFRPLNVSESHYVNMKCKYDLIPGNLGIATDTNPYVDKVPGLTIPPYSGIIVADGAIAYWPLDETSGQLKDRVGTINATIVGAPILGQPGIGNANCIVLNGSDYLTLPSLPAFGPNFTLESWIKPSNFVTGAWATILSTALNAVGDFAWGIVNTIPILKFRFQLGPPYPVNDWTVSIPLNVWSYIVITGNATNIRAYLNGVELTPAWAQAISGSRAGSTVIGRYAGTGENWIGGLQDLAIYPIALTPTQIKAHYEIRVPPVPPTAYQSAIITDGAVSYWPLDEVSGTIANDKTGTRPGTISGAITLNQPGPDANSKSMLFGSSGIILCPPYPTLTGGFTLETWFKCLGVVSNTQALIMRAVVTDGDFDWRTSPTSTNLLFHYFAGAHFTINFPASFPIGSWCHLALTGSPAGQFISYINGVGSAPQSSTVMIGNGGGQSALGNLADGPFNGANGYLADMAIYQKVLTPAQILAHYKLRVP